MKLMEMTMTAFLEELASSSPAPGGGSVSAVLGAYAAGLGSMVCRLTIGNDKYKDAQNVLPSVLDELERQREILTRLVDEDTQAFDRVMAAFKLPKGTEQEIAARKAAIGAANIGATEIPMMTATAALAVAKALIPVVTYGNTNALSDCGVGMECAYTAAQGALMNVAINLPGVKDAQKAAEFGAQQEQLKAQSAQYHKEGLDILRQKLDF